MPAGTSTNLALAEQLLDALDTLSGLHPGFRPAHAKGLICSGTFTASPEAAKCRRTGRKCPRQSGAAFQTWLPDPRCLRCRCGRWPQRRRAWRDVFACQYPFGMSKGTALRPRAVQVPSVLGPLTFSLSR